MAKFSFLLICATLALSVIFIGLSQNFDSFFQESFDKNVGESRSGWFDPNYFGTVLGMGSVAALIELYHKGNKSSFLKVLYIITFIVSILALIKIASRGALIALLFATLVILFKSKMKLHFKLIICFTSVIFIYYLYNNDYMNIIVYRLENQGLETGRIDIWKDKLSAFSNLGIVNIIFGVGNRGVVDLGSERISMHNDFLSCLVQYGLLGFVIFIVLLFKPIFILFKYGNRLLFTLTATIYLVTSLFTLNPMTGGQTPYYLFVAYIYFLAKTYDGFDIPNKFLKRLH